MSRLAALLGAILWLAVIGGLPAAAHEIRPVFLDIREIGAGRYDVTWKTPVANGMTLPVAPRFPSGCAVRNGGPRVNGATSVSRIALQCPDGLAGKAIVFEGLSRTMVDGLIRLQFASGEVATARVSPTAPAYVTPSGSGPMDVLRTYTALGVEHILSGYDHLLFVLALVLLVKRLRRVLATATAFTLAHSITLSLAALGIVRFPPPLIEALIAASILMLAVELVRAIQDPVRTSGLRPAALAFAFGLLHGLGFAGALAEIGLPRHEIPLALFGFNAGVEIGQVLFILALGAIGHLIRPLSAPRKLMAYRACTYVIGSLAAFWTIERVMAF